VPTKTAPSIPLLSWTGEREYAERLEGRDKGRERSLTSYHHGQNRLNCGRKGSLIHHQSNQSRTVRNKTRSQKYLPPTLPFFPGSTSLPFLSLLPPSSAGGQGMGVMVSSSHAVSAAPSSSEGGLLTLCPCSSLRSLSRETVLHKLLQRESIPWAAALHELPQRGSFLRVAFLQEQATPAWVPHGVTSPASKPAPAWTPLSTGLQVLAGACSSVGSPQGHSLLQASTSSGMRSLLRATGGDLLHHRPPWVAGEQPASPWSSS